MLYASIFSHIGLGVLLSLFFVLYYINTDGKWKVYTEMLIGIGGNVGGIFVLDNVIKVENNVIRMYSIGSCIFSFLCFTFILLIIMSYIIKDKSDKDIIRLRDILLGEVSWIKKYYEGRMHEIDIRLNIPKLKERERQIENRERAISQKELIIKEEFTKLESLGNTKLRLNLPENAKIILTKDYLDIMPSYLYDIFQSIYNMSSCTKSFLNQSQDSIGINEFKAYLVLTATYIANDIFGIKSPHVRIHFRYYNKERDGYEKLVSIIAGKLDGKPMTLIPFEQDSMIKKSYECKKALIKSVNIDHDYISNNFTIWEDYMTYTFYNLVTDRKSEPEKIPFLSFGISVKDASRYKKNFYLLNYFKFDMFLKENLEDINNFIDIEKIMYGGQ